MKIKRFAISMTAALLLTLSCSPVKSFAAPEEPTTLAAASSSETAPPEDITEPATDVDWQELRDNYQEEILERVEEQKKNEKKTPDDYYNDPYYDTDGNAELIESKGYKVIYSSAELLFTAVTTKDGHVFYIIIDYTDKDGKDNVYFLNKVDDFDLYSLLENGKNNSAPSNSSNSSEKKKSSAEEYLAQKATSAQSDNSDTTTTTAQKTNTGASKLKLFFLLGLVVVIGAAGWIIPKFMNKPKKNNVDFEDDELEEVNEDEQ